MSTIDKAVPIRLTEAMDRPLSDGISNHHRSVVGGVLPPRSDWGKPYAARFEVWFKPDSGKAERRLAERIFRIEGWQR